MPADEAFGRRIPVPSGGDSGSDSEIPDPPRRRVQLNLVRFGGNKVGLPTVGGSARPPAFRAISRACMTRIGGRRAGPAGLRQIHGIPPGFRVRFPAPTVPEADGIALRPNGSKLPWPPTDRPESPPSAKVALFNEDKNKGHFS